MNMPDEIWLTDTTFRDGQQSRPPYTVKQIVDLYDLIHKLGGKRGLYVNVSFSFIMKRIRKRSENALSEAINIRKLPDGSGR